MSLFARVAVNVPGIAHLFDYEIPEHLIEKLRCGCLVEVPFGKQRVQGVVKEIIGQPEVQQTREILELLDNEPVLTLNLLNLAFALAEKYFSTPAAFLNLMLPPGLSRKADTLYQLNLPANLQPDELTKLQQRIIMKMKDRGALRGRQMDAAFRHVNWQPSVRALIRKGLIISRAVLPAPAVSQKTERTVALAIRREELRLVLEKTGKKDSQASERRQKALFMLAEEDSPVEVSRVYAASGANATDLRYLEKKGLVRLTHIEVWRDPLKGAHTDLGEVPTLTADQQKVWEEMEKLMDRGDASRPILLRGVTGSGKTEIYMRAIQKTLDAGKQALMLVPEISLTPQTIQRFMGRFPGKVGVVHSKLSPGERYDTWRRARAGDFSIVIGARSALFTPFPEPGVIVLDECHDASYCQTEVQPYYSAVEAARMYGADSRAMVIFGSATPNVDLVYRAKQERWPLFELPLRVLAHSRSSDERMKTASLPLPPVDVVDMRAELKTGNSSIFSRKLSMELERVLSAGQQAILLLNRRGSASYIFCRDCGHVLKCPHCDFPLTLHSGNAELICHTCGYQRNLPKTCPKCGSSRIRQYGSGTEKVEMLLKQRFPTARILRWDADTTRGKGSEEVILSHFRQHNADILVGTQMLAKGLDLPLVTLVGVVLADVGLNFPDYRTAERTFQLLTQVAGRAGRSALGGCVVIQTFNPDHYAIQHASRHDFSGFYLQELEHRQRLRYPPFVEMVRFEARELKNDEAQRKAQGLAYRLQNLVERCGDKSLTVSGPLPPYFARRSGYYRWQIILKGNRLQKVLAGENFAEFRVGVDPPDLL